MISVNCWAPVQFGYGLGVVRANLGFGSGGSSAKRFFCQGERRSHLEQVSSACG